MLGLFEKEMPSPQATFCDDLSAADCDVNCSSPSAAPSVCCYFSTTFCVIQHTMESSRGPPRVKNKAPAPQQISAEQLLREAVDRQEPGLQAPTQRFADLEELHEFQGRKRKEFEDYIRRNRINMVSSSVNSAIRINITDSQ